MALIKIKRLTLFLVEAHDLFNVLLLWQLIFVDGESVHALSLMNAFQRFYLAVQSIGANHGVAKIIALQNALNCRDLRLFIIK